MIILLYDRLTLLSPVRLGCVFELQGLPVRWSKGCVSGFSVTILKNRLDSIS